MEILALERSLLSEGRWTDPKDSFLAGQSSWCHGAAGIALGRLAMFSRTDKADLREDANLALEEAAKSFNLNNHSLCHGELGNLETMLVASKVFSTNLQWNQFVEKQAKLIFKSISKNGWRTARPGFVEVPGLMTGIAGIGFELLRLEYPTKIPSVLLLEAPLETE